MEALHYLLQVLVLLKYLLYPEKVNILLTATESMKAPSLHSTQLAAHMVDVLSGEARFPPQQLRILLPPSCHLRRRIP